MHRHELAVLNALKASKKLSLQELLKETQLGKDEVMWAVQNLASSKAVEIKKERIEEVALTKEGEEYAVKGLPEQMLVKKIGAKQVEISKLSSKEEQIGFMWAKKKGLVAIEKGVVKLTDKGREAEAKGIDEERILREICAGKESYEKYRSSEVVLEFKKRGLIETKSREEVREIALTPEGMLLIANEKPSETQRIGVLDRNSIKARSWAGKKFTPYKIDAPVEPADAATHHPLRRMINELREAYVSLGFMEVSGPIIEPAFWVFDNLFVPQDHPARDVQDTFFLGRPNELEIKDKRLVERIKKAHEKAWHGEWSEKIAMQAVARTHTTSVTGRYINEIVSKINKGEKFDLPVKIFTVGRNLRNENIDPKHTADFYQHDGIIIGKNLTLANLFDTLIKLYKALGVDNLKFKPYYYPFVEPGVLMLGKVDNEWLELGGAGVIRKEITGTERNSISVLAWGPGVERILLFKKRVKSITELYGSSVDWLRERSIL